MCHISTGTASALAMAASDETLPTVCICPFFWHPPCCMFVSSESISAMLPLQQDFITSMIDVFMADQGPFVASLYASYLQLTTLYLCICRRSQLLQNKAYLIIMVGTSPAAHLTTILFTSLHPTRHLRRMNVKRSSAWSNKSHPRCQEYQSLIRSGLTSVKSSQACIGVQQRGSQLVCFNFCRASMQISRSYTLPCTRVGDL